MPRTTLRDLNEFDNTPAALTDAVLVMVDFQNTYTRGVMELDGWEHALQEAADLLARARVAGTPVVHIVNDGGAGTPYDIHSEIGQIHPAVAPINGESVVEKTVPNAFVGTGLGELLDATGRRNIILAGFMTNMCVLFTAEGAFLHGKTPTVVADACATRSLETAIGEVSAPQLHSSALATITDLYGVVVRKSGDLS